MMEEHRMMCCLQICFAVMTSQTLNFSISKTASVLLMLVRRPKVSGSYVFLCYRMTKLSLLI